MTEQIKINWYRCKVDKTVMSQLMKKSDARGFLQAILPLVIWAATGTLAWYAYRNVHADNWPWALPLLLLALFVHGTNASFFANASGSPATRPRQAVRNGASASSVIIQGETLV